MVPPIIVDNKGDILLFGTVQEAEGDLEPIDVKNHEYIAYDSEGRRLELAIKMPERFGVRLRRLLFPVETTQLVAVEKEPDSAEELKDKLRTHLHRSEQLLSQKVRYEARLLEHIERLKSIISALSSQRAGGTTNQSR